ncbi:hypothetical protein GCM10011584_12700 [Nocardioides phosphati]|uniref:Sulfotransferase family protein n=1 Tax=Nocardioides phosphati TaxID=1867775 RepID=A0ABQ2N8F7_9ACTN|nr:hypothetical protein [Nocardioides phosphati]GGO87626.1 hypothetical protein GCM10011584_12700 [Nocardioides phosphati]
MSALRLPERGRLLHIGLPKSGSTTLQQACAATRPELLAHGVLYPGDMTDHAHAGSWLAGVPLSHLGRTRARPDGWAPVLAEMRAHPDHRVLLSYEAICWTDLDQARHAAAALEGPAHGLLVLRNPGDFLVSAWQQNLKGGNGASLDGALREAFRNADTAALSRPFHRRDGLDLVTRWATALGPENLTVVVLEPAHPDRLLATAEELLGLPERLLRDATVPGGANRGLSVEEAAFLHRVNSTILREWGATPSLHRQLVFRGAVHSLVTNRRPGPDERPIRLPAWAAEPATERGDRLAAAVAATGVRVVGDPAELRRTPVTGGTDVRTLPAAIPSDVAVEALLGLYAAAAASLEEAAETPDLPRPLEAAAGRALAGALARVVRRRLTPGR